MFLLQKLIAILLLIHSYLLISPFVHAYVPISLISLSLSLLIIVSLIYLRCSTRIRKSLFLITLFILCPFVISAIYWESFVLSIYPKFLIFSIITVWMLEARTHLYFIKYSTVFLFFQCILAIIGFVYAAFGGQPILDVTIGWGRTFSFYLTSFSVTNYVGFIRPSGLFDEPGALSFFTCFVAVLREIYHQNRKYTILLLTLGFITLSLAHAIFVFLYLFHVSIITKRWKVLIIFVTSTIFTLLILNSFLEKNYLIDYAISRATSDVEGGRGALMVNAYEIIRSGDWLSFVFGVDSNCLTDYIDNCRYIYPAMGENYLSLIAFAGVGPSWIYYFYTFLIIILLFVKPRVAFPLFALSVLFWQRPVIFMIGYSIVFAYLIFEVAKLFKKGEGNAI